MPPPDPFLLWFTLLLGTTIAWFVLNDPPPNT